MATVTKIYGPPGTGKTTRLLQIVEHEIKNNNVPRERIAYLSHTRAANEVIVERLQERGIVGSNPARDIPWFRTIHSSCARMIGIGRGAVIEPRFDYRKFFEEHKMLVTPHDTLDAMESFSELNDNFNVALNAYSYSINTMQNIDEVCAALPQHPCLAKAARDQFFKAWKDFKGRYGKWDFTDMLLEYVNGPDRPLPVSVGIIDEAQDLSDLQWKIILKMFANCERIYMAGDDDQAIYGFIGGSEFGFYRFPANEEMVLERSYRVPKDIGDRATKIIRVLPERKEKDVIWRSTPGSVNVAGWDEMQMPWKEWGKKSVMVLTRHRRGTNRFARTLREIGVPHAVNGVHVGATLEGDVYATCLRLRMGEKVRPKHIANIYKILGHRDNERKYRNLSVKERQAVVGIKDIDIDLSGNWLFQFTRRSRWLEKKFFEIDRVVHQHGIDAILQAPTVNISTMHAAKGREADIVVIEPDCTDIVKKNVLLPAEVRLAYVSLTRAKEAVIVRLPSTKIYIDHFI
jgi:DNA helicase-2/ATP-dependent DNA helicase PcrA